MKWTHVCPLLGVVLFACATGENEFPGPLGLETGGDTAGGSTDASGTGGSATEGGSFASGGSSAAGTSGASTGGSFGFSGASSFGGTFSTAGTTAAGGGSGGTGGATGGGGAGGKATGGSGGAGGTSTGGTGGTGGGTSAQCGGTTIPAKNTWMATALRSSNADPPDKVHDGDDTTRYASGSPQAGDEWLQIDFGAAVTINQITMHTNNNDYFRHYQLRLSNKSQDFAAAILKEADGVTGTITVPLAATHSGRYLTIRQTGMVSPTWWSLHEVSVACK